MKQLLRRALNKVGFDVVRTRNQHADQAAHLRNVLASRDVDCVIDVGANVGQYGEFLRSLGYRGRIVSFEPARAVYEELRRRTERDGNWQCHNIALGADSEERALNVYSSTVFSSFLPPNEYAKEVWTSLGEGKQERVPVVRLDDVWGKFVGTPHRALLKIDTQGFDLQVFQGARKVLPHVVALQSELSLIPLYEGSAGGLEMLTEYQRQGFLVSGMYPINRDRSLAVVEFDCVLVKRDAP